MKTFVKILLYLFGFPLMIGAMVYVSLPILEAGKSYGILIYAGVIVVALMGLLYLIVALVTWNVSRKAKSITKVRKATAAFVIFALILTTGVWLAIDRFVPDILDDATSGTITYDDLRDDYMAHAEYHELLLTKFIKMNVKNGNLTSLTEEEYLAQGYKNEEVRNLIHHNFKSLDKDGYCSFTDAGPWLDLANDSRMTLPVVVHLVINQRKESTEDPEIEDIDFYYGGEGRAAAGLTDSPIRWTILDMQEGELTFEFAIPEGFDSYLSLLQPLLPEILRALNKSIKDEALAGSVITIGMKIIGDEDVAQDPSLVAGTMKITITPASEARGVWDYMHMAWLDSNHLLFAVISLFPARRIMFAFAGLIVLLSLMIGFVRESEFKKRMGIQSSPDSATPPYTPRKIVTDDNVSTPYVKAYFSNYGTYYDPRQKPQPRR
jgi:hypothetical protein